MRVFSLKDFADADDDCKELIACVYNGHYFDLYEAVKLIQKHPEFFEEKTITKGIFKKADNISSDRYIRVVAEARYKAVIELEKYPHISLPLIELFDDYTLISSDYTYVKIINEYRKTKRYAYALLY